MAHIAQYYYPSLLKPEIYGVGSPMLLETIHVSTTFKLKHHDSNHNP